MALVGSAAVRETADIALIGLFALVIWLPTGDWIVDLDDAPTPVEKRRLAAMPDIRCTAEAIGPFPVEFEAYFNDHFGYRKRLIRWHSKVSTKWLGVPPSPNVIHGKDGWLFYAGERVIDYQRARYPFSREELVEWQRVLEERRDWLAARGIRYLMMVAPNKHSIYPEYLPTWVTRVGEATRLDQLLAHMKASSDIDILDPRGPVREAKRDGIVYFRTGTHWNERGAFVGYQVLMKRLSRWFPRARALERTDFNSRIVNEKGEELAIMLGQQDTIRESKPIFVCRVPRLARSVDAGELTTRRPWGKARGPVVMEREDGQIPRAVMFRDSFSIPLIPFLSEHFGRIVYLWQYDFDTKVIERERPDVVILQMTERALASHPPKNPPMHQARPGGPPGPVDPPPGL